MIETTRYVWTIARRDYLASVMSRAFLLFLVAPLLPFAFGDLFAGHEGSLGASRSADIFITGPESQTRLWINARNVLVARMPSADLPSLKTSKPAKADLVLTGSVAQPILRGDKSPTSEQLTGVALIVDQARFTVEEQNAPRITSPLRLEFPANSAADSKMEAGLLAQIGALILTMLLSGMMLSSLVEERSTKALDVLVAALPVHVIFYGKLLSVLLMAATGMAVWVACALWFATPALAGLNVVPPAIGWPIFSVLALIYAFAAILLFGAIYLAAGAYASTARDLQAVAVPLTMVQVFSFALALNGAQASDPTFRLAAFVVPWSSPFAMLAVAADGRALIPHLLALGWQIVCVYVVVRWSASAFRESVLNGKPLTLIGRLQAMRSR